MFINKNILLLTAHPDDEIMFFYPTIKNLIKYNNIHLLCLSNGDYENKGKTREKELYDLSCTIGFNKTTIYDFEDNIKLFWDSNKIVSILNDYIKRQNINIIFTFDSEGVSNHPNHISCCNSVINIKNIELYMLESVSFYRKFLSFFDLLNISKNNLNFYNFNLPQLIYYMSFHWSQFNWYRILFLFFSRYSFINSFTPLI